MYKTCFIGAFAVAMVFTSGCSSLMGKNHLVGSGGLNAQPMIVVSRPHEFGIKVIGDSEGSASTSKFLFFTVAGDQPDGMKMPVLGNGAKGSLETLACYRAAKANGGDAFYSINTQWNKKNVLYIFRTYDVKVTGKSLKITDLGDLSEERADKEVNRTVPKKGGLFSGGGFLSSLPLPF